ncbi:hypothetical protein [Aquabacter spiritensis]|uniref:Hpr(Ser) kinase/phosphatase n=1 Tax=Aquabacter spiritensis TaxID=933073 RepID=A0A4R3M1I8_9HYPH|nr:hypothetical protein [Aquabacter spiritensis]TCT05017.1 hypothetical protein EDC64_10548 [Aquabacter spiritensis]
MPQNDRVSTGPDAPGNGRGRDLSRDDRSPWDRRRALPLAWAEPSWILDGLLGCGAQLGAFGLCTLPFATLRIRDRTVLLVADSHGGKSTLALQGLLRGHGVLDDNMTWFDRRDRALFIGRPIMLRRDGWRQFRAGARDPNLGPDLVPDLDLRVFSYFDGGVLVRAPRAAPLLSPHPIDVIAFPWRHPIDARAQPFGRTDGRTRADDLYRARMRRPPDARQAALLDAIFARAAQVVDLVYDEAGAGMAALAAVVDAETAGRP